MIRTDHCGAVTDYCKVYATPKDRKTVKPGDTMQLEKDMAGSTSYVNRAEGASVSISEEGKKIQEEAENASEENTAYKGKIGVNAGKIARKIAAAKTRDQLRAVIVEIKGDLQEVKAGLEKGMCDQSEVDKVNALLAMAQKRMGEVEDRKATPEEESMFALASLM